jgi:hypothetical protein
MVVFYDVAPCSLVETDRRFRGAHCFNEGDEIDFQDDVGSTGTQSLIRNPWDQTRFGNRNSSDFGMVVRGIRGQELSESIAQLISTN